MIDKTGARLWYGQQRASGRSAIARNAFASPILAAFRFPGLMTRAARLELWSRLGTQTLNPEQCVALALP